MGNQLQVKPVPDLFDFASCCQQYRGSRATILLGPLSICRLWWSALRQ